MQPQEPTPSHNEGINIVSTRPRNYRRRSHIEGVWRQSVPGHESFAERIQYCRCPSQRKRKVYTISGPPESATAQDTGARANYRQDVQETEKDILKMVWTGKQPESSTDSTAQSRVFGPHIRRKRSQSLQVGTLRKEKAARFQNGHIAKHFFPPPKKTRSIQEGFKALHSSLSLQTERDEVSKGHAIVETEYERPPVTLLHSEENGLQALGTDETEAVIDAYNSATADVINTVTDEHAISNANVGDTIRSENGTLRRVQCFSSISDSSTKEIVSRRISGRAFVPLSMGMKTMMPDGSFETCSNVSQIAKSDSSASRISDAPTLVSSGESVHIVSPVTPPPTFKAESPRFSFQPGDESEFSTGRLQRQLSIVLEKPRSRSTNSKRGARLGLQMLLERHPGVDSTTMHTLEERYKKLAAEYNEARPSGSDLESPISEISSSAFFSASETASSATSPAISGNITPERVISAANVTGCSDQNAAESVSAIDAEQILLSIMQNVHTLPDLFSCATINKGFYRVFKKHELRLLMAVIHRSDEHALKFIAVEGQRGLTPRLLLRAYKRNANVLLQLRTLMLERCASMLRPDTLSGLIGADIEMSIRIDKALWKIWAMCVLFGTSPETREDIKAQADWLSGHGRETTLGFSFASDAIKQRALGQDELFDINEMWFALCSLLHGFKGRLAEARQACVFARIICGERHTETACLDEWIAQLPASGLMTVLELSTADFEQAKKLGLTSWQPSSSPGIRPQFIRDAVLRTYEQALIAEAAMQRMVTPPLPPRASRRSKTRPQVLTIDTNLHSYVKPRSSSSCSSSGTVQLRRSSTRHSGPLPIASATALYNLSLHPRASTQIGATLFSSVTTPDTVIDTNTPSFPALERQSRTPHCSPTCATSSQLARMNTSTLIQASPSKTQPASQPRRKKAHIVDPVDRALSVLVHDMGFSPALAKKALNKSDSGWGIDLQAAIEMLVSGEDLDVNSPRIGRREFGRERVPAAINRRPVSASQRTSIRPPGSPGEAVEIVRKPAAQQEKTGRLSEGVPSSVVLGAMVPKPLVTHANHAKVVTVIESNSGADKENEASGGMHKNWTKRKSFSKGTVDVIGLGKLHIPRRRVAPKEGVLDCPT